MRELIIVVLIASIAYPIANLLNAEKWVIADMEERFQNARRERSSEVRLQGEGILSSAENRRQSK